MMLRILNFKNSSIIIFLICCQFSFSQSVLGKWKTVDDVTGKEKGIVEVYEKNGRIYGKIIEIFDAERRHSKCEKCQGSDKNKPILGLTIIKGLKKDGSEYNDGQVLDPKTGKLYKCYITLEEKDKLKVRGYIGVSLLGRTQYWYRIK